MKGAEGRYMENNWVTAHEAGAKIYKAVTGIDIALYRLALVLRNSDYAAAVDYPGSVPTASDAVPGNTSHAALALPVMSESEVCFHEEEAGKWTGAILGAAHDQNWPVLDGRTLAPLTNPTVVDCAMVETQRIADWIAARIPDTAAVVMISNALGQMRAGAIGGTPEERGAILESRFRELKASGCKAPLIKLVKETGLSRARIGQLRRIAAEEDNRASTVAGMLKKTTKNKK